MRRCLLLALLAAATLPALAAKRVTVEQLNQMLAAAHGKPDAEMARRLSDLELTERPSGPTLLRWEADLPGSNASQALALLANAAAFLDVPSSEIPPRATPDHNSQRAIMGLTVDYVSRTIHQLPNLFATRATTHFEDAPQGFENGGMVFVPAQPLHFASQSSTTVVYRDGAEVSDPSLARAAKYAASVHGLTTSGEFGPILVRVLVDAAQSALVWSHWEPGPSSLVAVFRYAVPQEKSHYEVSYCCIPDRGTDAFDSKPFHQIVGYHGEIAVDPASGSVLRLTAEADLKPIDPIVRADIMVEYGPVEIGGKSYICPVRSVSISVGHALQAPEAGQFRIASREQSIQYAPGHLQTLLNEVRFTQYHLFHADTRIMAAGTASSDENPTASSSPNASGANATVANASPSPAQPTPAEDTPPATPAKADAAVVAASPEPATSSSEATAAPVASAPLLASPPSTPDFDVPDLNTPTQGKVPVFKAKSEAVVVDVVVRKSNDEPVPGLNKEDFRVLEDGKPQRVDYFEEHAATRVPASLPPPMPPHVFTNEPVVTAGDSVNVLLLDSLNTDREDQIYVHQQILSFLKTMQPNMQVAVFLLSSNLRLIHGFTTDSSVLQNALNDKKYGASPTRTGGSRSLQDKLDNQNEVATLSAAQMSGIGLEEVQNSQAQYATSQADKRVTITLQAMNEIARYLAAVPGRKNLIWFSSSFPISVFPNAREKQTADAQREYDAAVKKTADLLTLSKVAVYPVGAEGVMSEHPMEASNSGPVDTEGASADNRMPGSTSQRQGAGDAPMVPYADEHRARAAKIAAMEQLAADTGGEAIFNTNDLNKALARAIDNGSHYYTLVYTPTNKNMDGKYRHVEVKLNNGKYKLAYRRGYYADDAAKDKTGPDDSAPTADPLRPFLVRGMPNATQLLYGVRVLPATQQPAANAERAGGNASLTGPVTRYSVDFMIRWTDVDLQTTPQGTSRGQIQVDLIAYGKDGKPLNWISTTQRMNLDATTFAAIRRSGIPAHVEIDLPRQDVYLATGVYDWGSRRVGTLEVPVKLSEPQAALTSQGATRGDPN